MKDYERLKMSGFAKETPLGVAMVKAAYDIGYDFFPNLYREEVKATLRNDDVGFLMEYIRYYLVNDDFSSLREFSGAQSCPPFPDDGTTFLLRCIDNTLFDEMKALSNDCYLALDKGVVDGYMDTMRNIINSLKPIGRYKLCDGIAIEVYHVEHSRNEVLADIVSDNEMEDLDKLYPPAWCKICNNYDQEEGFLYGRVFVPFNQTLRR